MRPVKLFRSVMAKLGLNGESQDPKDLARIRFEYKYMRASCYEYTYVYIYIDMHRALHPLYTNTYTGMCLCMHTQFCMHVCICVNVYMH